jgi:aspartate/methionine/tyrosine aminotransferase
MAMKTSDLGKSVLETEYAVRGPIVARAQELERSGKDIIYCNIGNPQALEQKPLSWVRQILALCEYPELARLAPTAFPADVMEVADRLIKGTRFGLGAYSESKGVRFIREEVAHFIAQRDGIPSDPDAIYLTDGASKGVQAALRMLISGPGDGIMVPIPQYPLYSATITLYEGKQVNYYLDEHNDWKLSRQMLDQSIAEARHSGIKVKAIVVINPGNPTGSVLDAENIGMIIDFAKEQGLAILADEVYQENIYHPKDRFTSFAKVMAGRNETDVSLFSFHSTSKGFLGECGHRGGYFEIRNIPADVAAQILKLQSVSLCANLPGQIAVYCMINPPKPGSPSYATYTAERNGILGTLKERATILAEGLNQIPGIRCNAVAGAMYAFPMVKLPAGRTDTQWCMSLLEATGICVVPGSGFGQLPGTAHFRTTILPPTDRIKKVVQLIGEFHRNYR